MTADNRAAQECVLNNQADLALFIEPPPDLVAEGLELHSLYPIAYLAALPPKHRLTKRSELTLSDLLILGNSNTVGRALLENRILLGGEVTIVEGLTNLEQLLVSSSRYNKN